MIQENEPSMAPGQRRLIIWAALLALFLGALDALVMSAAMPTIVAQLGGMSLYAWVYSAYFLSRAVSLPVIGTLSDLYSVKKLMLISIAVFALASGVAGASPSMGVLVGARVFQGIGAGGIFALVYVVLSDVSTSENRGKILSLASAVWGISSVVGPTLGGFVVTYFSWSWIFYMNLPLGLLSFIGIGLFFREEREKSGRKRPDLLGICCFSGSVLGALILIMTGGRDVPWGSVPGISLCMSTLVLGAGFFWAEKRAEQPFLNFDLFRVPEFVLGCAAGFGASFIMFSLFAYAPLFLQGALGKSPMVVGYAMLSMSLGWSMGSVLIGGSINRLGRKRVAVAGATLMSAGAMGCLSFGSASSLAFCLGVFTVIGFGMGFVVLGTLLIVQDSLPREHLGVATSLHQFARTLGGAVGVGLCGSLVFSKMMAVSDLPGLSSGASHNFQETLSRMFQPGFADKVPAATLDALHHAILDGVGAAFMAVAVVSAVSLILSLFLRDGAGADGGQPAKG